MYIAMFSMPRMLQVSVRSRIEDAGVDLIYRIPKGSPAYARHARSFSIDCAPTVDAVRALHRDALSPASGVTVEYPKLQVHINAANAAMICLKEM